MDLRISNVVNEKVIRATNTVRRKMALKLQLFNLERVPVQSRGIVGKYAYYILKAPDQREIYSTFHNRGVNRIAGIAVRGIMLARWRLSPVRL